MLFHCIEECWTAAGVEASYHHALRTALVPRPNGTVTEEQEAPKLSSLPRLCFAAAGGDGQMIAAVDEAWQLLYTALHLLDSVEDGDALKEAWTQWGLGGAINVSTGLIASTGVLLSRLDEFGAPPDVASAIRHDFFGTLLQMTAGQHADLTLPEPTLQQCWQIAAAKSGVWFALACRSGARLATAGTADIERFAQFGRHLGILIQIGDDIDGLWAKDGTRSDLVNWPRWTLPVAYAMSVLDEVGRNRLGAYLRTAPDDRSAEAEARRMVIEAGAVLYLAVEARRHQQIARNLLVTNTPSSINHSHLLALLDTHTPFTK
jgi:geranylgeranyl diphosphate synthase type I